MQPIESLIPGSEKLLAIFGRWPSFHDAEVIQIQLSRVHAGNRSNRYEGPVLFARVHTWDITNEVDSTGHYVLKNHTLVTLRFSDVRELKLEGFNHQNAISGLTILPKETSDAGSSKYHVEFDPSFGVDAFFDCSAIEVVDATAMTGTTSED
jgi:hypothetical protein